MADAIFNDPETPRIGRTAEAIEAADQQGRNRQALALFPLLRTAQEKALSDDHGARLAAVALLDAAEGELRLGLQENLIGVIRASVSTARTLLEKLTEHWESVDTADADLLWGLFDGITESLKNRSGQKARPGEVGGFAMNNEQVRLCLQRMVSIAHLLRDYLRAEGDGPTGEAMYIGGELASSIGVLGDHILEQDMVGGVPEWFVVTDFRDRGVRYD
jgi:hypothetical protein